MASCAFETQPQEDEFEILPKEIAEVTDKHQLVKLFALYLVENIENNLKFYLNILEDKPNTPRKNTVATNAIGSAAAALFESKWISSAMNSGEIFILNKIDEKHSKTLAEVIFYFNENKTAFRQILIEAAVEIFSSFEQQFAQVTCNGGPRRAMFKLALDAAYRILQYFLNNDLELKNFGKNNFSEALILGTSKRDNYRKRTGKTVKLGEATWKTASIFTKPGIYLKSEDSFYASEKSNSGKYGYRLIFPWEQLDKNWIKQENNIERKCYTIEASEKLINKVNEFIMRMDSNEEAKLERQLYHTESMDDRQEKQREILEALNENFEKFIIDLSTQYQASREKFESRMDEIQDVVQATKEEHSAELRTIKENQEKLQDATITINKEMIKEIVAEDVKKQSLETKINKTIKVAKKDVNNELKRFKKKMKW